MKATSKLISVVLILAICLSMFTVSAFAAVPVAGGDANQVLGNYHPGVRQPAANDTQDVGEDDAQDDTQDDAQDNAQDDAQDNAQDDAQDDSAETNKVTAQDGFTEVANAEELQNALDAQIASIKLTEQIDWVGSLKLDYDVTIDLGGSGKGITFSGSGDAAVLSKANAKLVNGNLFVSGDVAATDDAAAVLGFKTVAAGVGEGSVYLNGVYVSFSNAGENAIFGQNVSLGSGVFSQDVSAYYGEETAAAYDFATLDNGMFDVTAKNAAPAETDAQDDSEDAGEDEPVDEAEKVNGEVISVTGEYGEGEDKIVVSVSGANMPKDLRVEVKPMDNSALQVGDDQEVLFVVDITLFAKDENGEEFEYEPADDPNVKEVSVTIRHPALGNVEEGEAVTLYHIVNEQAVPVTSPEEIAGQESMGFSTDSFSPYGAAKTVLTGSDGDVHYREVKILGEEISLVNKDIVLSYTGNKKPIAVSIVPYEDALSGDYEVYEQGLLLSDGTDYTLTSNKLTIKAAATQTAPEGKFGIVFWYQDQGTMVYMVQPIILVNKDGVFGVGDNFTPTDAAKEGTTGVFDAELCDYDSVQVKMTGDLKSFSITGGDNVVSYDATSNKKKITIGGKTYNASEYFTVSEYSAADPLGHEFVNGKVLTLSQSLMKMLGFHDDDSIILNVTAVGTDGSDIAGGPFVINIAPGIRVADGLDDYIKGKNLWVKFQACAPIDYDADGTLAIWIGGQKISHEYYSISNDHCTLWIYRNLLDQLKSNNRYTLTARLWQFVEDPVTGEKVKETYYPATASFNVLAAGSTSSKSPKTGDESNVALWASVLVLSGGAVVALIPKKKKSGVK